MTVIFKRTSPKNLESKGKLSTLAIQALKTIKKDNVTDEQIEKIVNHLKNENPKYLAHDIELAPRWIADIMSKAQTN
jgi:septum formation inhibitor-activating ATPase MinD